MREIREKAEQALREVEKLKQELASVRTEKTENNLRQYNETIRELEAIEWLELGLSYDDSENYQKAIKAYTKAIELDQKSAAAYNNRGLIYRKKGQYNKAIAVFSRAIELNRTRKQLASPKPGGFYQLYEPEKDGPMEGSSIPPAPVYSSRFLMVVEDISFATSLHWHSGHWGGGSLENSRSTSKQ